MALVIYIDVLLVVNLYINYFLVRGTSLMLRRKVSPRRVILASAVGAVGSLLILVPDLNPILCVLIKIALGIGITFAARLEAMQKQQEQMMKERQNKK